MKKLHIWECALLTAFSLTLISGVWAAGAQSALADRVVRLHVIANSDSEADQALKFKVRDGVLSAAADRLAGIGDRESAEAVLAGILPELAEAGAAVAAAEGYGYPVAVSLEDCWFPTREYDGFALPAGTYRAVRVTIGEGRGRNWWCVIFPPLCLGAVSERAEDAMAGLSDEQVALITGEDQGYVVRFKLVEWWNSLFPRGSSR